MVRFSRVKPRLLKTHEITAINGDSRPRRRFYGRITAKHSGAGMADRVPDPKRSSRHLWPDRQTGWYSQTFKADRPNTVRPSPQHPIAVASRHQFTGKNHQSGEGSAAIKTGERRRNPD